MMESHHGTAGKPILSILEKNNFVNILVVVTRYFGGILLGTGGLVKAYSNSTMLALKNAKCIEIDFGYKINVSVSYEELEKFKYFCKINSINILEEKFSENINLNIEITKEKLELLKIFCLENFKSTKIDILSQIYVRK